MAEADYANLVTVAPGRRSYVSVMMRSWVRRALAVAAEYLG
jgi:hypothetical protein